MIDRNRSKVSFLVFQNFRSKNFFCSQNLAIKRLRSFRLKNWLSGILDRRRRGRSFGSSEAIKKCGIHTRRRKLCKFQMQKFHESSHLRNEWTDRDGREENLLKCPALHPFHTSDMIELARVRPSATKPRTRFDLSTYPLLWFLLFWH